MPKGSAIRRAAGVWASGNLGSAVVKALLDAIFEVTALTRQDSKATFPAVRRVDLTLLGETAEALKGQDAIVWTVAPAASSGQQKILIDAAIAAKVKHFIPSGFGVHTRHARGTKIGAFLRPKIEITDYLIEIWKKYDWFTWTALSTGAFLTGQVKNEIELWLEDDLANTLQSIRNASLAFYLKNKTATIFDSAVLKKTKQTTNQYLGVASFTATQNETLKIIEEETGSKFRITNVVKITDVEKRGDEKLAQGDSSGFVDYIHNA